MKPTILKFSALFLAGIFLFAAMAYKPASDKKTTGKDYNGYWVAKSGDEYTIMSKAMFVERSFEKNEKGDLKNIDNDMVKNALHFRNESKVNGKTVDAHFFILTTQDMEASMDMNSVSPKAGPAYPKVFNCTGFSGPGYYMCSAYYACQGVIVNGWIATSACTGAGSTYCRAFHYATGATYYISCSNY